MRLFPEQKRQRGARLTPMHNDGSDQDMSKSFLSSARSAKFSLGQIVKHRDYPFRGVIFDVDPVYNNSEEWYLSIPEDKRPDRNQPFYHLFAENADSEYIAYVSEQNLIADTSGEPVRHSQVTQAFEQGDDGELILPARFTN